MTQKRRSPHKAGNAAQAGRLGAWEVYRTPRRSARLPDNWRDRLPDPAAFYGQHVAKLGKPRNGWAQGLCPFHEDRAASFSVHVDNPRGGWKCFAGCGSGDMVSFIEKLRGCDFKDAVRELVGVRA